MFGCGIRGQGCGLGGRRCGFRGEGCGIERSRMWFWEVKDVVSEVLFFAGASSGA